MTLTASVVLVCRRCGLPVSSMLSFTIPNNTGIDTGGTVASTAWGWCDCERPDTWDTRAPDTRAPTAFMSALTPEPRKPTDPPPHRSKREQRKQWREDAKRGRS